MTCQYWVHRLSMKIEKTQMSENGIRTGLGPTASIMSPTGGPSTNIRNTWSVVIQLRMRRFGLSTG